MPDRLQNILRLLHEEYPDATCALEYSQAHELLFATIMSAQTTDGDVVQEV
jgi:endonuclease III